MTLHEIKARKAALTSTINSFKRQAEPLEKELKELEKLEAKMLKEDSKNKEESGK